MRPSQLRIVMAAVALGLAAPAARAQTVTSEDWSFFLEETYSRYGKADPYDLEDQLFAASEAKKSREAAIADFAERLKIGRGQAEQYADLIIEGLRARISCSRKCGLRAGTPLYERAAALGLEEPTGGLLLSVAKNATQDDVSEGTADLIRLLLRHRAAAVILRRLANYNEKPALMLGYLAALPSAELEDEPMIVPNLEPVDEDASGWFDAMIEANEERLGETGAPPAFRASLAQLALGRMLRVGLTKEAAARYFRYPEALRRRLPIFPAPGGPDNRDCERRQSGYRLADDLAAALWLEGREAEARSLLDRARVEASDADTVVALRREALLEAMTPARADAELFDLLFDRDPQSPEGGDRNRPCSFEGSGGWFGAMASASPGLVELVARRVAAAGHAEIAAALRIRQAGPPTVSAELRNLSFLVPADGEARQRRWAAAIEAAARARREAAPAVAAVPSAVRVHVAPLEPWWVERPLPPGTSPGSKDRAALPKGLALPVSADSVLRHESSGGEHALLYQSGEYDLPGEIPGFGLWFVRTRGGRWTRPLYLGLQEYFPYQVMSRSALPLLDGDRLRIEARVREIDPGSITFPPVALRVRNERDGLFLEMDLARVAADRDSDGLTDIEERTLGLDFLAADTDGDSLADGVDPMPLTPVRGTPDRVRDAVAAAVVGKIFGHDAGAISIRPAEKGRGDDLGRVLGAGSVPPDRRRRTVFLIADEELFAGFDDPTLRLLLYSKADVEAVRGKAPFFVPEITTYFRSLDGLSHFFTWSARWVGGTFLVRCDPGGSACRVEERMSWIT